jgi:hypothetical protein
MFEIRDCRPVGFNCLLVDNYGFMKGHEEYQVYKTAADDAIFFWFWFLAGHAPAILILA